jgi:hypothetical protein
MLTVITVGLPVIQPAPAPPRLVGHDPERGRLLARARLVWHAVEAAIAIAAGAIARSIALIAVAADSLIEALAGTIVHWRIAANRASSMTASVIFEIRSGDTSVP